jgi:hypothetical protein
MWILAVRGLPTGQASDMIGLDEVRNFQTRNPHVIFLWNMNLYHLSYIVCHDLAWLCIIKCHHCTVDRAERMHACMHA